MQYQQQPPYGSQPYNSQPYNNQTINQQPLRSQLTFDGRWNSGLCDCCSDCKSCCLAYWCWPCFLCCLDGAARECACTTFGIEVLTGSTLGIAMLRSKIRGAYKIEGSVIEDCCCAVWCPCCTALQVYRELQYKGETN